MSTTATPKTTVAGWKKNAVHTVTCPSGTVVAIKIPDLPGLIKAGQIPNNLLDAAIDTVSGTKKIDKEFVVEQGEFINKLVAITVVDPVITETDAEDIPAEDKEMLAEFATRQRDYDVLGHHFAGLHTNKDFRSFRGLDPLDEDVEGL